MKTQFKVLSRTIEVTKYSNPETKVDEETGEEYQVEGMPIEGKTTFKVELSTVDIDNVNSVVGNVYVTLDKITEYTGEAKDEVAKQLAKIGLYEELEPDPLEQAKQLRWSRIVAIRDGLEAKGFEYLGKTFDSDQRSALRILFTAQAATTAALTGQDFSVDWTTADNSIVAMTRDQILGMPAAMALKANAIHMQARNLKEQLNQAGSIEEVNAVKWPGVEYQVEEAYNPFDENGDLPESTGESA